MTKSNEVVNHQTANLCKPIQHPQRHWYPSPREYWAYGSLYCMTHVLSFINGSQWKVQSPSVYTVALGKNRDQRRIWGTCFSFLCLCVLPPQFPSKSQFPKAQGPVDGPPQCSLYFTIPQAVDDGVQHGSHHRVGERQQLLALRRVAGPRSKVCEDGSAVEEGDNQQVGGAGWRRPCASPLLRASRRQWRGCGHRIPGSTRKGRG